MSIPVKTKHPPLAVHSANRGWFLQNMKGLSLKYFTANAVLTSEALKPPPK